MSTRSSALGTRIAVPPPPFSAVPETCSASHFARSNVTVLQTTPTSRPVGTARHQLTMSTGSLDDIVESLTLPGERATKQERVGRVCHGEPAATIDIRVEHVGRGGVGYRDGGVERGSGGVLSSGWRGQRRANKPQAKPRPASAQSSMRAAVTPSTTAPSRRQEYRPRRLPPSWDDNSSAGASSGTGAGRRRNREGKAVATAAVGSGTRAPLDLEKERAEGGDVRRKLWDDCFAPRAGPAVDRAASAKAVYSSDAVAAGTPRRSSPKRQRGTGAAAALGRPYMSRAELVAEESKEATQLRNEVEFWRAEAGVAREEAVAAHKRLETQEEHIVAVLQQTAEVLPAYSYGLDLSAAPGSDLPRLPILDHRRELERSMIIKRLRLQVSQLTERLAVAEESLAQLQRSCQFTALTEMLTAAEEYAHEVARLRAKLHDGDRKFQQQSDGHEQVAIPYDSGQSRVVAIPIVNPAGTSASTTDEADGGRHAVSEGDQPIVTRHIKGESQQQQQQQQRQQQQQTQQAQPESEDITTAGERDVENPKDQDAIDNYCKKRPRQQQHQRVPGWTAGSHATPTRGSSNFRGRERDGEDSSRRALGHAYKGCSGARARARAGLLGVPAPGGNRGPIAIDGPMRGAASVGRVRVGGGGGGEKRRMTTEMEMDVMKGLVLAQHQRIERQRAKMQELERDLRDYRRAAVVGGEWPQALGPLSASQPHLPRWKGLTPSRSAPAGLDRLTGKRAAAAATAAAIRTPSNNNGIQRPTGQNSHTPGDAPDRRKNDPNLQGDYDQQAAASNSATKTGRPRTACCATSTPAGKYSVERRRSFGGGRGVGGGCRLRPRSASSRLSSSSPGRSRAGVGGVRGRGALAGEAGVGRENQAPLPEGWAEAVDTTTGHVYFYSDSRSTWVRPTKPASPRILPSTATVDRDSNAAGGDYEPRHRLVASSSASLLEAAAGLAGSLLEAATTKAGAEEETRQKTDNEGAWGQERERQEVAAVTEDDSFAGCGGSALTGGRRQAAGDAGDSALEATAAVADVGHSVPAGSSITNHDALSETRAPSPGTRYVVPLSKTDSGAVFHRGESDKARLTAVREREWTEIERSESPPVFTGGVGLPTKEEGKSRGAAEGVERARSPLPKRETAITRDNGDSSGDNAYRDNAAVRADSKMSHQRDETERGCHAYPRRGRDFVATGIDKVLSPEPTTTPSSGDAGTDRTVEDTAGRGDRHESEGERLRGGGVAAARDALGSDNEGDSVAPSCAEEGVTQEPPLEAEGTISPLKTQKSDDSSSPRDTSSSATRNRREDRENVHPSSSLPPQDEGASTSSSSERQGRQRSRGWLSQNASEHEERPPGSQQRVEKTSGKEEDDTCFRISATSTTSGAAHERFGFGSQDSDGRAPLATVSVDGSDSGGEGVAESEGGEESDAAGTYEDDFDCD